MTESPKPDWRRVRFGDVVRLNIDRCANPVAEGIERYVGLEHLEPGDLRIRRWGFVADGTTFTNRFRPGQVLFGKRRAYQRKVAVADLEGVCSGDIYVFEPKDDRLLPELLPFVCQTDAFFEHAVGTSAGSLSPRTNWTSIAEYEFGLPPLEVQRSLAAILQAASISAEGADELAIAASELYRAATHETFSAMRQGYELAPLPVACETVTVGIVVKPAQYYVAPGQGVPALIMKNVQRGELDLSDLNYISPAGHQAHKKSELKQGDVVAVRSSGSEGRTGDAAMVPPELAGANCIDLLLVRPGPKLDSGFLCSFLNSPETRSALLAGSTGTMQKHLNAGTLKRLEIPLPPLSVQRVAMARFDAIESARKRALLRRTEGLRLISRLLEETLGGH